MLIEGESGTGKEMLVRAMHAASPALQSPAALRQRRRDPRQPDRIGAVRAREGRVPRRVRPPYRRAPACRRRHPGARRDRPPARPVQERLAGFLARGDVRPIGARHSFRIDLRLFAASNAPLAELVASGEFRADLLDSLGAVQVTLPAAARAARATSRRSPAIFSAGSASSRACARWASPTARWRCWRPTTGRATSASFRRCCSAPRCSATATR